MGSEWKKVRLSEIGKIVTGKTPPTKNKENFGDKYPFITPRDMRGQKYIRYTERYLSDIGFNLLESVAIPPNSICVTCIGSMGKIAMSSELSITNQQINSIIPNDEYDPSFIYYCLKPKEDYFKSISGGTTMPILNKTDFSNIEIEVPPLPEQQKIASILSAFDDKIELNNEMNKTLEEIAQAIFKHWFIDFEFPNENGEPYKSSGGEFVDSELGPIPKGWKVVNLREILDNICDSVKPGKEIEGLPYVPIDIIERKSIALKQFKSWEEAQSSLIKFKKDDILLGAMRVYFHKVSIAPCEGITRKTCFVLRPKKRFDLSYTLLLIFQDDTIKFADAHSKGTTMPYAVWDNGLAEMKIALPTEKIRQRFNELLYPIISKIRDCIFENLTLSQLRDTLLPKLISGEIRVM